MEKQERHKCFVDPNNAKPGDTVVLGFLLGSHVGDAMCTTPLPRMLTRKFGWRIYVSRHRSTIGVFLNNPYVCGFTATKGVSLRTMLKGSGHYIQRLQRGFGVPIQTIPKPEIYLSRAEIEWATQTREKWPQDRPVCILSTRVITDNLRYDFERINWDVIASAWSKVCTVIQPVLTDHMYYERFVGNLPLEMKMQWKPEPICADAIVYENLSLRQYMSLFAVAHYYCGGTSGGAHIAAAFDVRSAIMIWRFVRENLQFPSYGHNLNVINFLYPQHHFICAEDCEKGQTGYKWLDTAIEAVIDESLDVAKPPIIHEPDGL